MTKEKPLKKNTDAQIKTEAESREPAPGKQDVTAAEGWGKQESRLGRGNKGKGAKELKTRHFPSCACSLSMTLSR